MMLIPAPLRAAWPRIRPHIESIRERCHEAWLVEDVYAAIASGQAQLWEREDGSGGVVLRIETPAYGEPLLLVWLAWSDDGDLIAEIDQIKGLARQAGLRTVAFDSPRRGWERRAPGLGWRALFTRWVMEA